MSTGESADDLASGAALIGPNVRAAREARGMSLRELASRIGVSPSFISQLERNKVNASVGTLYALVDGLGLSIDELMSNGRSEPSFSRPSETQARSRSTIEKPFQSADSRARIQFPGVIWERLTQAADPYVDFLHVEYGPGSASCPADDMMRHGGHEYGVVLEGELHVQIGFESYVVAPGDSVTFDSMTPHRLSNPGGDTCRAIWVVVGRRDDDRADALPPPTGSVTHLPSLGS